MSGDGQGAAKARITVITYGPDSFTERDVEHPEESVPAADSALVTWINVEGVQDAAALEAAGKAFGLHPLVLESIANARQRPKLEEYPNCLFVVVKMFSHHVGTDAIEAEQVSLVLGSNFLISFQEREGDAFDGVRERLRNARGRVRGTGADYLLYCLIDAVVDGYFLTCEQLGEEVEGLEDEVLSNPRPEVAARVQQLRRKVIFLRKAIWPLRDVISGLMREDSPLVRPETGVFLRDVYDHTIQVMDTVESSRDIIAGLLDIYLSSISYHLNEVMKVLTIIATVFIPLTFVVGVYGMNFHYMPELGWRYGYAAVWAAMVLAAGAMLLYFRRKGWL